MDIVMKTRLTLTAFATLCGAVIVDEPASLFVTPS